MAGRDAGMIPAHAVGLTILTAFEVPNMYSGLLPSLFTISTFSGGSAEKAEHTKKWIRRGEIQATVMSVTLAIGAASLASSPWPLLATLAMCAYLLWQYELALRKGISDGPAIDMQSGANPVAA